MPVYCYTYEPALPYLWTIESKKGKITKSICERLALNTRRQLDVESTDTMKSILKFFQDPSE